MRINESKPETNEGKLVAKARRYLNDLEDSYFWKARGDPRQQKGVSDLIGCYHGRFYALEFKIRKNKPTLYQIEFMRKIKRAGGRAYVVRSMADVKRVFK